MPTVNTDGSRSDDNSRDASDLDEESDNNGDSVDDVDATPAAHQLEVFQDEKVTDRSSVLRSQLSVQTNSSRSSSSLLSADVRRQVSTSSSTSQGNFFTRSAYNARTQYRTRALKLF